MTCAQIPTEHGKFDLYLYRGTFDSKDHLAFVLGDVAAQPDVLVRIHSECLTGEVFGSTRCDCQPQLGEALRLIAREGAGVVVYLRQEGRGIGLLNKLRAYNLQDQGYDTVDANLMLGHGADERDYVIGAEILRDLGVRSLRLLTNNPSKIDAMEALGFPRPVRIPLEPEITADNARYLGTKAARMGHLFGRPEVACPGPATPEHLSLDDLKPSQPPGGGVFVTLTYAQSLDGSISARRGAPLAISGRQSLVMTHTLRAAHDTLLVGIETVLADDPSLTVRMAEGPDPTPIVLDSHLRMPPSARLLQRRRTAPLIATTEHADPALQRMLERAGARVVRLPADPDGRVDLAALLDYLARTGVRSVMVEGGARVITSFLSGHFVDRVVLTIAPMFVGGLSAVENLSRINGNGFPALSSIKSRILGRDVVLFGDLKRSQPLRAEPLADPGASGPA